MHAANLGSISVTQYGPPSLSVVTLSREPRVRSEHQAHASKRTYANCRDREKDI